MSSKKDKDALLNLAKFYEKNSLTEKAKKSYIKLMNRHPYDGEGFYLYANLLAKEERYFEALAYLKLAHSKATFFYRSDQGRVIPFSLVEKIKKDLQKINKAEIVFSKKSTRHLILHGLIQSLIESGEAMDRKLLEQMLEVGDTLLEMLIGMVQYPDSVVYSGGEFWPPIHVARILGEIRSKKAIEVLVNQLSSDIDFLKQESMASLAKIGENFPEEVSHSLEKVIADGEEDDAIIAAMETMGWLGDIGENYDFLLTMLENISEVKKNLRSDFAEFCCGALADIKKKEAKKLILQFYEKNKNWLEHEEIKFFADDSEIVKGKHYILEQSIFDKCCRKMSQDELMKSITATVVRDIINRQSESLEEEENLQIPQDEEELCSCGSGKKYRECCLSHDELEEMVDYKFKETKRSLWAKIYNFATEFRFYNDMKNAIEIFYGQNYKQFYFKSEEERVRFFDWFIHDYRLEGSRKVIIDCFFMEGALDLDEFEREVLRDWRNSLFSIYEVKKTKPEEGAVLYDLLDGSLLKVYDFNISKDVSKGDLLVTRIVSIQERYYLLETAIIFPPIYKEDLLKFIQSEFLKYRKKINKNISQKNFIREHSYIFTRFIEGIKPISPR